MSRLARAQNWFNKINPTQDDQIHVGIDAHKRANHIAIWLNDNLATDFVMPAGSKNLIQMLQKLRPALKMIAYEAGPTGYTLARQLQNANLPVKVVAPSKTPRQSAPDSKTDRLDCRKLAQYVAKGLLKPIAIPTKIQEAQRQLSRLRDQLVDKQRRVKLQIKSFLLQHGISEPPGLKSWSLTAIEKLQQIPLSKHLRHCLDALLQQLHFIKTQLKTTDRKLNQLFNNGPLSTRSRMLLTHPGVGPTIAKQFCTEIFNPKRFNHKTEVAKYIGLAPRISQSGSSQKSGTILKTGRPQLRSNLIEAAWIWIRKDPHAYKTYIRLVHNTGQKNKAITAMARKMAINLWRMACDNKPYIPQTL